MTKPRRHHDMNVTRITCRLIESELNSMEDFNDFMKSAIVQEKESCIKRWTDLNPSLNEAEKEYLSEVYSDEYQQIDDTFYKIALESQVVMTYSLVETSMVSLCNALRQEKEKQTHQKISLNCDDLKGEGYLGQTKNYIQKVIGVDLKIGNNPQWEDIQQLRCIRNAIVHNRGWVKTNKVNSSKTKGHIQFKQTELNNGTEYGELIIQDKYLDYVLQQVKIFFDIFKKDLLSPKG